jgi:hypothetical protein
MTAGNRRLVRISAKGVSAIEHRRSELRPRILRTSMTIALLAMSFIEPAKAQDGGKRGVRDACREDYTRLCAGVAPGGGRIKKCMADNAANLSPRCQTALGAAGKPD